jgi:hypothetical protein
MADMEIGAVDAETMELAKSLMKMSGIDDVSGDDDSAGDVEIGATRGRVRRGGGGVSALQLARMLGKGRPQATVREAGPKDAYTRVLPFVRDAGHGGVIPANTTVEIPAQSNQTFKPEALLISDESAQDFLIEDIKLGPESIWAGEGPIPATEFSGDSVLGKLVLRTEQLSQRAVIKVTNRSADARPFYGYFLGLGAI